MQHMTASRDGVEIAYATYGTRDGGDSPAVVLVHGWSGNRAYWAYQIDVLAERYHGRALMPSRFDAPAIVSGPLR